MRGPGSGIRIPGYSGHMSGRLWRWTVAVCMALALYACRPTGSATPVEQPAAAQAPAQPAVEPPRLAPSAATHDLSVDEAMGGHTLARHVGKTDAELIERLRREPQISSASTYTDRATAENVVGSALQSDNPALAAWRARRGRRPNFVLHYDADRVIGRSMARGHSTAVQCERALLVLRWDDQRRRSYVLTSYPEADR